MYCLILANLSQILTVAVLPYLSKLILDTYCSLISQHINKIQIDTEGYASGLQLFRPTSAQNITEVLVEWSRIGQESCSHDDITNQSETPLIHKSVNFCETPLLITSNLNLQDFKRIQDLFYGINSIPFKVQNNPWEKFIFPSFYSFLHCEKSVNRCKE